MYSPNLHKKKKREREKEKKKKETLLVIWPRTCIKFDGIDGIYGIVLLYANMGTS